MWRCGGSWPCRLVDSASSWCFLMTRLRSALVAWVAQQCCFLLDTSSWQLGPENPTSEALMWPADAQGTRSWALELFLLDMNCYPERQHLSRPPCDLEAGPFCYHFWNHEHFLITPVAKFLSPLTARPAPGFLPGSGFSLIFLPTTGDLLWYTMLDFGSHGAHAPSCGSS